MMSMKRIIRLMLASVLASAAVVNAIYPSDHWSYSTKLTQDNYAQKIQSGIDEGKTVFAPAWNAVTKTFASNPDVIFMDVNLSENQIRESPNGDSYSPGAGGWPTIRYFNEQTGIAGGAYEKKTDSSMCDELGKDDMMEAYVEEYGNTSTCSVESGEGCDEREVGFIAKFKVKSVEDQKAQMVRLEGMEGKPMKPELLMWLKKRKKILKQLVAAGAGSDEL